MTGGYFLGIDVGTTEVHAATARETLDGDLLCVDAPLGDEGGGAPALAFVTPDGSLQYGQRARESGILEPERLIREYRCSVGDDLPLFVGGHRVRPDEVLAGAIASVVETVTASEGAAPLGLALTHPTSWGPHRRDVVRSALAARGIPRIEMVPEPEAAARHHDAARGFEPGQALLMYDLGAAALDVTLLRKGAEGDWVVVGEPLTMSDVGGSCFDDAVLAHVLDVAPPEDHGAEPDEIRRGLAQLRQECAAAREELSFDPEVVIPLAALGRQTTVRLTRSEFEGMIDQQIERTCDALEDLLEDSGTSMDEVDAILLVGGASRTPRVAQHLSEQFDRPMVLDPHARSVAALGAARVGWSRRGKALPAHGQEVSVDEPKGGAVDDLQPGTRAGGESATEEHAAVTSSSGSFPSNHGRRRRSKWSHVRSMGALVAVATVLTGGSLSYSLTSALSDAADEKEESSEVLQLSTPLGDDIMMTVAAKADKDPLGLIAALDDPDRIPEAVLKPDKKKPPLTQAFTRTAPRAQNRSHVLREVACQRSPHWSQRVIA